MKFTRENVSDRMNNNNYPPYEKGSHPIIVYPQGMQVPVMPPT